MCKHQNGEFIEVMNATHTRIVSNSIMETKGNNEIGNIEQYEFRCDDCNKHMVFKNILKAPKWVRTLYEAL
jgi:hypothetical protein